MSYTDLTSDFVYRLLLTWAKMDALAENDAFDSFPSGTRTFFYSSTVPTGWSQVTGHTDKALRVVSGAGGGSGGSTNFSSTVTLAHTHGGGSHSHGGYDHSHGLAATGSANFDVSVTDARSVRSSGGLLKIQNTGGIGAVTRHYASAGSSTDGNSDTSSSDTPGTTNSQLSDVTFSYADVIIGEKAA